MSEPRYDYGPRGCCGPVGFATLALLIGLVTWIVAAVVS